MNVNNNLVSVLNIEVEDYISLTDLARYKNQEEPGDVIIKWMSNKSSFDFIRCGKSYQMKILKSRNSATLKKTHQHNHLL